MLWWFAETTCVAMVLACAAGLIGRLPRMGPTARHILWVVVLIKLLTPPVVRSPWPVSLPDAWLAASAKPAPPEAPSIQPGPPPATEPVGEVSLAVDHSHGQPALVSAHADFDVDIDRVGTVHHEVRAAAPRGISSFDWPRKLRRPGRDEIQEWLFAGWMVGTLAVGLIQLARIVKFRRKVSDAIPAPKWLADEAEQMAARLGVHGPEVLVVPGLTTPMLWCLGRPQLLVPGRLIKSIEATCWRGILAHELAHLCRGDHWVSRLELLAGLFWWWNPLYWLTRSQIDAEAELACDAWVVWALPEDRTTYAEVLFRLCSEFSRATRAAPALGVAGSGRFFERRLTMILRDHVPCRVSPLTLAAACLLALLALPSWTLARPSAQTPADESSPLAFKQTAKDMAPSQVRDADQDQDDDDAAIDDDADDDDAPKSKNAQSDKDKAPASRRHESKDLRNKKDKAKADADDPDIEKEIESALGPDFEKKIEAWAEKFSKEIESKFGDNSEFAKKMESLGKEMESKFGDNSEFAKKMELLGKEMEKKFGDDSEFAKKMESLGKDLEKKLGPGSDFEKKLKEKLDAKAARAAKENKKSVKPKAETALKAKSRVQRREERIKALEVKIDSLMKELKELKETDEEDGDIRR